MSNASPLTPKNPSINPLYFSGSEQRARGAEEIAQAALRAHSTPSNNIAAPETALRERFRQFNEQQGPINNPTPAQIEEGRALALRAHAAPTSDPKNLLPYSENGRRPSVSSTDYALLYNPPVADPFLSSTLSTTEKAKTAFLAVLALIASLALIIIPTIFTNR